MKLLGDSSDEGGSYFTIWAPRQSGKSWIRQQVIRLLRELDTYDIINLNLDSFKMLNTEQEFFSAFIKRVNLLFDKQLPEINTWDDFLMLFTGRFFSRPVILILDEFDALNENLINKIVSVFRQIYITRMDDPRLSHDKTFLLHGVVLIGVRSVLGIDNERGSPFNVQRSVLIPNLTDNEVRYMFDWYQRESEQEIMGEVVEKIIRETRGQPGLESWFGELLTEKFNDHPQKPITMNEWNRVFVRALRSEPNNTVMNLVSKVKEGECKDIVLDLYRKKIPFSFDNPLHNFLYMNGVIDFAELVSGDTYELSCRFSSPFVQKRIFNKFCPAFFPSAGSLFTSFGSLDAVVSERDIDIRGLIALYSEYLVRNKDYILGEVPRRQDRKVYESMYHFNFYSYLYEVLREKGIQVIPEFPTGNGKLDLLLRYKGAMWAIEVKSGIVGSDFKGMVSQARHYAVQLGLECVYLVHFLDLSFGAVKDFQGAHVYQEDVEGQTREVTVEVFMVSTVE